jgi:hypothetical protein
VLATVGLELFVAVSGAWTAAVLPLEKDLECGASFLISLGMQRSVQLDFQAHVERILDKLKQVREARKPSFGSESHTFLLAERVSLKSIRLFESQHGIILPEDYRQFLLSAGGSGAGPYYGILPLDKWDNATAAGRNSLPADYLARPCPLVPGAKPKLSADNEFRISPSDEFLQGSIALVSQGCCYFAILIISGPATGRVAYISEDVSEMAYFPENPNFLSWYERWLDELLAGYDTSWFGYGAVGTEEELALRLQDSAVSAENKNEALGTLMRINQLTPSTMKLLSSFSTDRGEAPIPRATAASLFIIRSLHEDPAYVSQLLQDRSADVREQVLVALTTRKSPMLANAVRQGIQDEDSKVAKTALLYGKGILTRSEIEPFLKSQNVGLRRTAIYALGHAPDVQVDELIALASRETDQDCRIYAIQALRDLKNRSAVSALEELLKREPDKLIRTNLLRALQSIQS